MMGGLFDGTPWERPVTCAECGRPLEACRCPRDARGDLKRPQDQPARVHRERRSGGKTVTVVSGIDCVATDLEALLKELKSSLGAGGTVKEGRIEIQGDHRDRVAAILREKGYPAKAAGG